MAELGGFQQIAPYLTHPLVLAGFGLLLFFGLLRAVVKSGVIPTVSRTVGGKVLLILIRYGFALALVTIVFGFALAFFQAGRETVDVDQIIREFAAAREEAGGHRSTLDAVVRLAELKDSNAFRDAVVALVTRAKNPNARRSIEDAIDLLRQGEAAAAQSIFAEILDARLQDRANASQEAAEAARHLGAIAFVEDTTKAIEAYRTATELDPDDASSWIFLGRLYLRSGNLANGELALEHAQKAAERTGSERDQGLALIRIGDLRLSRGNLEGALDAYRRSHAIAEWLVRQDPDNAEWQRHLMTSFGKIGDVRMAEGNFEEALQAYEADLAIVEKLAEQDPNKSEWQRDLSVSLEQIGDVQLAQDNLKAALQAYRDRHAIAEKLAAQDPSHSEWQRDLSFSHQRIGYIQATQGDLAAALRRYQHGLAIRQRLATKDPSNAKWQHDLSISFMLIGDVQIARGDLAAALQAYQDGLAIREKLAAQDPSHTG